jgi:hypothetical protein
VADQLGARPLPVRLLEKKQAAAGAWMFWTTAAALALLLLVAYQTLLRPEVMITWIPLLVVVAVAAATLIRFLSTVQPIDLSPWLERDRSHSASAVLLYREARAALRYLEARRARVTTIAVSSSFSSIGVGVFVGLVIWPIVGGLTQWWIGLLGGIAAAWAIIYLFDHFRAPLPGGEHAGSSVMSLTANYRRFAATVVHHVEAGALGTARNVMICIDELDKVIDDSSVREFLRKMKGIFEVPGVYYYISLAEDTLARMYLAGAEGKNEIDSSLDHIVRVSPLTWDDSAHLVGLYAKRLGFDDVDPALASAIAAVSFGVPRDIIRRCDELVLSYAGAPSGTATVQDISIIPAAARHDRVDLACEREGWTHDIHARLSAPPLEACNSIVEMLHIETQERRQRLLALFWTLCACEAICKRGSDGNARIWKQLYEFGYDLPIAPVADMIATIQEIMGVLNAPPPAEPEPAVMTADAPRANRVLAAHMFMITKRNRKRAGNGANGLVK